MIQQLKRGQQMHAILRKLLHVSALTGPSSGSAQLHKTIAQPFYHSQRVEMSQVRHCMNIEVDMCKVIGTACSFECIHAQTCRLLQ